MATIDDFLNALESKKSYLHQYSSNIGGMRDAEPIKAVEYTPWLQKHQAAAAEAQRVGAPSNIAASAIYSAAYGRGSGSGNDSIGNSDSPAGIVGVDGFGGFNVGPDGVATAVSTGLTNSQAGVLGKVASAVTGIPGLSVIGQFFNASYNSLNESAAMGFNSPGPGHGYGDNGGFTGGGAMNVGGDSPTAGEAEGRANVGSVDSSESARNAEADSGRAAAAAAAEGSRSSGNGSGSGGKSQGTGEGANGNAGNGRD